MYQFVLRHGIASSGSSATSWPIPARGSTGICSESLKFAPETLPSSRGVSRVVFLTLGFMSWFLIVQLVAMCPFCPHLWHSPSFLRRSLSSGEPNPMGLGAFPWVLNKFGGGFGPCHASACSETWPVGFWTLCLLLKSFCLSAFSLYAG